MNISNPCAIVTGASRGIGRAISVKLARQGVNLVINYSGQAQAAQETADLCRAQGVEAVTVQADVSTSEGCTAIFETAKAEFGRVDILVCNAGITRDGLLLRMKDEDFDAVIATNLRGAYLCMKLASKLMMKQRFGRIIAISSVVGLHGNAGQANYAASKAGLIGMVKSLARELASRNVTVNAVAPGMIDTDMTRVLPEQVQKELLASVPMSRFGTPEDVANAVSFLVGEEAAYITGQVLSVDGGMAM